MRIACVLAVTLVAMLCGSVQAAPSARASHEIDQLINALGHSGCQFERNGSWHSSPKAQAHLQQKYQYLIKRDLVASAEQFIERAGSQSSFSGCDYHVRCPGQPAVTSASWLRSRLQQLRRAPTPAPAPAPAP